MMIQRIQTVYLLIATVLAGFFCCSSFGTFKAEEAMVSMYPKDFPVMLIVGLLVAVLLFISIFLYKDLRRQKTVTLVSMLLIVVLEVTGCFILFGGEGAMIEWTGGAVLLIGALVFALLAYRGMSRDQKLLRDSDRIR